MGKFQYVSTKTDLEGRSREPKATRIPKPQQKLQIYNKYYSFHKP
jgi:hypothetical protein